MTLLVRAQILTVSGASIHLSPTWMTRAPGHSIRFRNRLLEIQSLLPRGRFGLLRWRAPELVDPNDSTQRRHPVLVEALDREVIALPDRERAQLQHRALAREALVGLVQL